MNFRLTSWSCRRERKRLVANSVPGTMLHSRKSKGERPRFSQGTCGRGVQRCISMCRADLLRKNSTMPADDKSANALLRIVIAPGVAIGPGKAALKPSRNRGCYRRTRRRTCSTNRHLARIANLFSAPLRRRQPLLECLDGYQPAFADH